MEVTVSIRDLAQFVHRTGDLHYRYESATLGEEGIAAQRRYQAKMPSHYRREVPVEGSVAGLRLRGRIDGWDSKAHRVEEVKTTRTDVALLHSHIGEVHWAQVRFYAALLMRADPDLSSLQLALVYLHPDRDEKTVFEESRSREYLEQFLVESAEIYREFLDRVLARQARRTSECSTLDFPYPHFRDEQRRLGRSVFRAMRSGEHLLLESPTGSGKTVLAFYSVLRAMGEAHLDRAVFLSARTTGQRAAHKSLEDLLPRDGSIRAITITAKERACLKETMECDPAVCEYASGYFDRAGAARDELLDVALVGQAEVERAARRHTVCPFELSLDVAAWADVVVGDYNYVFDPLVRLRRLSHAIFKRVVVLVDEAHQLGDRVRSMLSAELDRDVVAKAIKAVPAWRARLTAIDRQLREASRSHATPRDESESNEHPLEIKRPDALHRSVDRFIREVAIEPATFEELTEALFAALKFSRAMTWADDRFAFTGISATRTRRVAVECLSPAEHIRSTLSEFHASVRLSATLTPPDVFQTIHGFTMSDPLAFSNGSFPPERLGVFVVSGISTFFRDREASLPAVVRAIEALTSTRTGNYLACFPSYAYARLVADALTDACVDIECRFPERGLAVERRDEVIDWIGEPAEKSRLLLAVMGGAFTESVDYSGLSGVTVVTTAIPPHSLGRDLIARDADEHGVDGEEIAYRQGAMTRVVQAAGRVIRKATDAGVVVLIDPRFRQSAYRAYFPTRWQPWLTEPHDLAATLEDFWRNIETLDRTATDAA